MAQRLRSPGAGHYPETTKGPPPSSGSEPSSVDPTGGPQAFRCLKASETSVMKIWSPRTETLFLPIVRLFLLP